VLNPLTHRRILERGIPARATVLAAGSPPAGVERFNLAITLDVHVEGRPPFEVADQWMVETADLAALTGGIPVKVDRDDATRVAIDWHAVREEWARTAPPEGEGLEETLGALGFDAQVQEGVAEHVRRRRGETG
jgi:hypothetical protein